jgi:DNA-binding transcriptional ArsR family regulator
MSEVDAGQLADWFRLLSVSNRIELLEQLRSARTLEEIRLQPDASQAGLRPERPISRPAIQNHLAQLVEAGLVRSRAAQRPGKRQANEYVLDHARLFAFVEAIRRVGDLTSDAPAEPSATAVAPGLAATHWEPGPKLVLVRGVREGRVFPLRHADLDGPRGWVIGRRDSCQVSLDYDPYVSTENAEIVRVGGSYRLLDLRLARNGTYLNWSRLPLGQDAPLRSGDIIGVGRSLLVFRDA